MCPALSTSQLRAENMLRSFLGVLALLVPALASSSAFAARPDLIEVEAAGRTYRGKTISHDESDFWLLERDGRLRRLPIKSVSRFRSLARTFQGFGAADMRAALRKEFGRKFDVVSTQHYVVAGPPGRARKVAELCENVYRTFATFFSVRGFHLDKPAFPLVAVVFQKREQFIRYARRDGVALASRILGYYHPESNRFAMYDDPKARLTQLGAGDRPEATTRFPVFARAGGLSTLEITIVHEGTHQVAFNTGLHTRVGQNPRWVVEGLATVFEASGIRRRSGDRGARSRINPDGLLGFRRYVAAGRKRRSLKDFIAGGSLFRKNIHHFYGEAWALSFFLLETRSQKYSTYLKLLARRDPLAPCTADERVADFRKAFGDDLDRLEIDYLRFVGGL
jgi:Protein of unknown function (DUF1570)